MSSGSVNTSGELLVGYYAGEPVYYNSTGTTSRNLINTINDKGRGFDELWDMMYVNPKPVIIVCAYCKCHNVVTNPACIQCGAPMGIGVERVFA